MKQTVMAVNDPIGSIGYSTIWHVSAPVHRRTLSCIGRRYSVALSVEARSIKPVVAVCGILISYF